jgi:NMD protein affecting ribosome stability and mRNA decay
MTNECPDCGRIMSDRERDEQRVCDDCYAADYHEDYVDPEYGIWARVDD